MKGRRREGLHPFSDDGNTTICKSLDAVLLQAERTKYGGD